MPNQENGEVKQLKLRIPMQLYVQLEIDARLHNEAPSTRARHILCDKLMDIPIVGADLERLKAYIDENWAKINKLTDGEGK